ncbi:nucleoid-associated protein [Enterococcus casseliflavus]|uniref:nucleoid-associated protein n=1 Tax=Enterococcus casseliflavus TaxID=37734 RepID=UPI0039A6C603
MPIEISKMIAHKLNINGGLPILSDRCIEIDSLEKPEEALDFFVTHIEKSRGNGFVKKCQFSNLDDQATTIKNRIMNIIANIEDPEKLDEVFVNESIEITRKLARIMQNSSSKSDGSLFVILYSIDGQNFIGLIKMDPDSGIEVLDDLTIKVREDMLPSKRERLHKAAFIICKEHYVENDTHLFVLDRQKNNDEGAKFFLDTFLDAKILPTDENLTMAYQKELVRILKDVLPQDSFMEFNKRFKRRLSTGVHFTLEEDFPPLLRDLLPENDQDQELDELCLNIQNSLLRKYPGEVTGFTPVVEKVNNFVFQSNDRSIKVEIASDAETDLYSQEFTENGTFVLTVYPDAGMDEIK